MTNVLSSVSLLLTLFIFIFLFFYWFANRLVRTVIGRKHEALERIHLTGDVPTGWTERYRRRLQELELQGAEPARCEKVKRKAERAVKMKLRRLEKYTRRSGLIRDEDIREVLLEDLEALRNGWMELPMPPERHLQP
ncbi:hypothetical protein [Paenibacillus mendelii]|uniref:Uncharacterized protein n=1 Tax=Paenibacillus mendelii TaxID=206163 RepID=A0ABV6J5T3_9BACL|nr:hypothetical protein [Paenibacillus mendelii]MCQ6560057.1 hypothetical protein [Paenibacillus mendelii]